MLRNPFRHKVSLAILFRIQLFLALVAFSSGFAQEVSYKTFGDGLRVMAKDSTFSMKMAFRIQIQYAGIQNLETDNWTDQILVRRARLKFDGFAFTPKLVYKVELGLSNRDLAGGHNLQTGFTSRVILDAVLKWNFYRSWWFWIGQTKLPGNRERVISSQDLQFVDRSLVNSWYNIDRDVGIQITHSDQIGAKGIVREIFSVSMGEGRNVITPNIGGFDYTLRLEYLPFGPFDDKGDYFSVDLEREKTPKLAIGITYDFNDGAAKQRGQLGLFMIDSLGTQFANDLHSVFLDAIFKYKGWSFQSEYAHKSAKEDIMVAVENGNLKYATGNGFVFQGGYLFHNNFELGLRYTRIRSDSMEYSSVVDANDYTLGVSHYIKNHNLKIQSDLSYRDRLNRDDFIQFRVQVEMAI